MKQLSRTILVLYVLVLAWLILFKFSSDFLLVLAEHQSRSLNLIPFADFAEGGIRQAIENFVVFIPLGLLLSVNFKQATLRRKLSFVFIFSLGAEIMQFVLAIGVTDITDVITNTAGGFLGLVFYALDSKHVDNTKLDQLIMIVSAILLVLVTVLRFLVFQIKY